MRKHSPLPIGNAVGCRCPLSRGGNAKGVEDVLQSHEAQLTSADRHNKLSQTWQLCQTLSARNEQTPGSCSSAKRTCAPTLRRICPRTLQRMAGGKQRGSGIARLALENRRTMPAPPSPQSLTSDPIEVGFRATTLQEVTCFWAYQTGHLVSRTEAITS